MCPTLQLKHIVAIQNRTEHICIYYFYYMIFIST